MTSAPTVRLSKPDDARPSPPPTSSMDAPTATISRVLDAVRRSAMPGWLWGCGLGFDALWAGCGGDEPPLLLAAAASARFSGTGRNAPPNGWMRRSVCVDGRLFF